MSKSNQPSRQLSQESVSSEERKLEITMSDVISRHFETHYHADELRHASQHNVYFPLEFIHVDFGATVIEVSGVMFHMHFRRDQSGQYRAQVEELPCQ